MKYIKLDGNALTNITELLKRHFSVNERDKISCIECRSLAEKILSNLPTIEVSEDCISREYILGEAFMSDEYNRETKSFDLPVVSVRDIENAPSVVPTADNLSAVEDAMKKEEA